MSFFKAEGRSIWAPELSDKPQPWYQRWLCFPLGHDWIPREWAKTNRVVFNPGFNPVQEFARLCTCNRCHSKKWIDGQHYGLMDSYYRKWEPGKYPVDSDGWPLLSSGSRMPLAKEPNKTGW